MKVSHLASLGFAVVALTFFSGCTKPAAAPAAAGANAKTQLTLDWKPEPEFGGFYAAQKDIFARNKLDVEIKSAGEGADTWQLVDSGKTDFATTAADQVLLARSKGADVVAIFAVYQTFPQGIMVHKARGFTSMKDVFSHDGFLEAEDDTYLHFLKAKYPEQKVTIKTITGGIADFLNKPDYSMQCFVTSEPILAKHKGSDPQTFLVADEGYNPYTTVVICRGETLRKDPEKVKSMAAACREGWRAYQDDPTAANIVMGQLNKEMDSQTFTEAAAAQKSLVETDESHKNGIGTMTADRWNTLAKQLLDLKVIKTAPKAEDCFVNP